MNTYRILEGNALDRLRTLPADHVQAVVTSPPYYGLRKYDGLPASWWGGDANCPHLNIDEAQPITREIRRGSGLETLSQQYRGGGKKHGRIPKFTIESAFCQDCGGWRGHLGLEPHPELFIANLVEIFRELRRVLRADGVCWMNFGDSYTNDGGVGAGGNLGRINRAYHQRNIRSGVPMGFKNKDLMMMPAEIAIALRNDGWYLRSEIVWSKRNPMPESVDDRPSKSHEMIYLLTKSERYFYDSYAIREKHTGTAHPRGQGTGRRNNVNRNDGGHGFSRAGISSDEYDEQKVAPREGTGSRPPITMRHRDFNPAGRNARTVWEIATMPSNWDFCLACSRFFNGRHRNAIKLLPPVNGVRPRQCVCDATDGWVDHFATFPERLVERCLAASTSEVGCCPLCRSPFQRVLEKRTKNESNCAKAGHQAAGKGHPTDQVREGHDIRQGPVVYAQTVGWRPTCKCANVVAIQQQVVMDLFAGSGTTGIVAMRRHCDAILIEASPKYVCLMQYRVKADRPLFNSLVVDVLPPAPAAPEPRLLHTADPAG